MRRALALEPFWVPLSQIADLTDRQMWEWYILPDIERGIAIQKMRDQDRYGTMPGGPWRIIGDDGAQVQSTDSDHEGVVDDQGRPVSAETFFAALRGAGVKVEEKRAGGEGK